MRYLFLIFVFMMGCGDDRERISISEAIKQAPSNVTVSCEDLTDTIKKCYVSESDPEEAIVLAIGGRDCVSIDVIGHHGCSGVTTSNSVYLQCD